MRILHLDSGREMRGGQWQVLRLMEGLESAGVENTLLARAGSPLFGAARERGWRVESLTFLRTAMLARHHDLVHAHDARGHTLAAIAGGAPLVVSRRVAFPIRSKWKYRRPCRILAVSEFVAGILIAGGVPREKIEVVYDGVPLAEESYGTRVIAPASSDAMKGAALASEAARLADVDLVLSKDLTRDLRNAALCVYITFSEGLGSGALLAMAAGVPVIASRVGGLPEVVRHGENGILVENDAASIASAISALVADPDRARQFGRAARHSVMAQFTVDHMVRHTLEVYRQVLAC